jgi:hypothetical protein
VLITYVRGRLMIRATFCVAICFLTLIGVGVASAQEPTRPFEALEASRRAGIELDRRMKRDADDQRRRDKERAVANVRQDAAAKKAASQPVPPITSGKATGTTVK